MKVLEMMKKEYAISPYARFLLKHGMKTTAVLYKNMNETLMRRTARAVRFILEETPAPEYKKGQSILINSDYNIKSMGIDENKALRVTQEGIVLANEAEYEKIPVENEYEKEIKQIIINNAKQMNSLKTSMRFVNHGNHTSMNFEVLLAQGLNGYRKQINNQLDVLEDYESIDFQNAMLDVIDGIEDYLARYKAKLMAIEDKDFKLNRLIKALDVVPANPPTNFYEAYTMMFVAMFFGDSLEPGRIDQLLYPYYLNDDSVDREEALSLIREFLSELEKRVPHPGTTHVTIGGSYPDGSPVYNELTELCVIAIRGLRAPNISLCVRDDMPQSLWDLCLYNFGKGYSQPALVNDSIFIEGFVKDYNIPRDRAVKYVFGGCSEVLIQGETCCDAVWAGYDVLDIFEDTMCSKLLECNSYEEFYKIFERDVKVTIKDMVEQTNMRQNDYALHHTYPIRSLLIGNCIERSLGYTAGGTKYNFSSAACFGATNTFNSLYTVKKFFEGEFGDLSKDDFLKAFACNYKGYESVYAKCVNMPKFGNFNEELNEIANRLMTYIFHELKTHRGTRANGRYLPTMIFWINWLKMGLCVGATPDGRMAAQPLADSVGASQGTDKEGPTASLGAALSVPQSECVGTCVFNLRLDSSNFKTEENLKKTQMLLSTYIHEGGNQLQISVVDKELLEDAIIHPEIHEDIIVRVGGFSDNFVYLTDEIKEQVMARTEL